MLKVARPLYLLHGDAQVRTLVERAARKEFRVIPSSSWLALTAEVRGGPAAALVLVDPYSEREVQEGPSPELRRLVRDFRSATVLALIKVQAVRLADVRMLGEWGVVEVVSVDTLDVAAVGLLLRTVRGRQLQRLVDGVVPERMTGPVRTILLAAAEAASVGGQTADLARALRVSTRTLVRWCDASSLPPPRELLAWMRVLLAAELMEDSSRTVERVAFACGYAADSGLRRAFRELVGTSPRALRETGAVLSTVGEAFRSALAEARRRSPRPDPVEA